MAGDISVVIHITENTWRSRLRHLAHPEESLGDFLHPVLESAFEDTQDVVHVITGSLKASGITDSSYSHDRWSGSITYGGPSPGSINDPVKYAWYEQRRGGAHDYMQNAHHFTDAFAEGIIDWMLE